MTRLFIHLCIADSDDGNKDFTEKQLVKFSLVADRAKDLQLECVHSLNLAGALFRDINGDYGIWARLGIILYGLKLDYLNQLPEKLSLLLRGNQ